MEKNYKNKYLKYKKKYLDLQQKAHNLQLIGGATCPNIGFRQHNTECWHDAYSTIFLFSDNVADHIQRIFDSTDSYKFDLEDCIRSALTKFSFPLPFNIERDDIALFTKLAREYVQNLYARYNNEKLNPYPYRKMPKTLTTEQIRFALEVQPTGSTGRPRRNSYNESLLCTKALFDFTNINLINPIPWAEQIHLGNNLHYLSISSLVNFFLLNYYPETLTFTNKPVTYLNFKIFDLLTLLSFPTPIAILDNADSIILHLNELLSLFNSDLCGIICFMGQKDSYDFENYKIHNDIGHAVSFFTCSGEDKFYDNHGIDTRYDIDEEEPTSYPIEVNKESTENDIHLVFQPRAKETMKTFMTYNWKDYFQGKMRYFIDKLKFFKTSSLKDKELMDEYRKCLLSFSDIFTGASNTPKCGREYLENFFVKELKFVTRNNYEKEIYLYNQTNPQNMLFMYSNKRIADLYLDKLNLVITNNNLMIIVHLLNIFRANNMKLFDLLLAKLKETNKGSTHLTTLLSFLGL